MIRLKKSQFNPVYLPYLFDERRTQLFFGGAGSGKSAFLAARAVICALQGRNVLVVRKVYARIKASCFNEVCKAMYRLHLEKYFTVSKSDLTLTARCGAQILFAGMDDAEKIKSLTPKKGVLTDIWLEEATELRYGDYKQLIKRLRGISRHKKRIWLSFNPTHSGHWIQKEFFGGFDEEKGLLEGEDLLILRTTYQDNRFLTGEDKRALEQETDPYFFRVYTKGLWGQVRGQIFTNYTVSAFDRDVPGETRIGLDFGFSADPCGCVKVRYDRKAHVVYVLEELYERGLTNRQLYEKVAPMAGRLPVICDSAEPKSICELRALGLNAHPAKKGPDSVLHAVQWLQGVRILVHPACQHMARELAGYVWEEDGAGDFLPRPRDRDNHLLDALRYALQSDMTRRFAATEQLN